MTTIYAPVSITKFFHSATSEFRSFTVTDEFGSHTYHTSDLGDGLWLCDGPDCGSHKQVAGTCQFTLAGTAKSTARGRITRRLAASDTY